jgi:hypothetical protein
MSSQEFELNASETKNSVSAGIELDTSAMPGSYVKAFVCDVETMVPIMPVPITIQ